MQKGYYSLLLKDYTDTAVDHRQLKYVYTSEVKVLSNQREVFDHLKFAFQRVSNICHYM